jgi:hypothetical protein
MATALRTVCSVVLCVATVAVCAGKPIASIATIEGNASVLPEAGPDWRDAKVKMPLRKGDQVYTREESFVEIRYTDGTVLRMNENTKLVLSSSTDKAAKAENPLGGVWVNMEKIAKGKSFELSSPTAVAAIRGTVFHMETGQDSSTSVSVFEGKVDVGPSGDLKKKLRNVEKETEPGDVTEVPPPEEIPGPFEVPLEQWRSIVAGQRISVRPDGKFAEETFETDPRQASWDAFVKRCMELDEQYRKEQEGKK